MSESGSGVPSESGLIVPSTELVGAEGSYGPFPEAGGPNDDLGWVASTLGLEDHMAAVGNGKRLDFEGLHLPAALGRISSKEIGRLRRFLLPPEEHMVMKDQGRWQYQSSGKPNSDFATYLIPDLYKLVQQDIGRLRDRGMPLELDEIVAKYQIADEFGHFDAINEDLHIDQLNWLASIPLSDDPDLDAYPTLFKLGRGRMRTLVGSKIGAYVDIEHPIAPFPGGSANGEIHAPAGVLLRLPNGVAHASPTGPEDAY